MVNFKNHTIKYIIGFATVILLLFTFIMISVQIRGSNVLPVDTFFQTLAVNIRQNFLTVIFLIITNLVNPITLVIFYVLLFIFAKNHRALLFKLLIYLAIISLLNVACKSLFIRQRPDESFWLTSANGYSFPSGHAVTSVAFYGYLIYVFRQFNISKKCKNLLTVLLSILITLICFSRVYLGVHYFSDVLAGASLSLAFLLVYIFITAKIKESSINLEHKQGEHKIVKSFSYAMQGIISAFQTETNLWIQLAGIILIITFGTALKLNALQWCICLILCFIIVALELVNTAIETVCDKITVQNDSKIKRAKDIAAGAVLVMSICAVVVGIIIFAPKIVNLFL